MKHLGIICIIASALIMISLSIFMSITIRNCVIDKRIDNKLIEYDLIEEKLNAE